MRNTIELKAGVVTQLTFANGSAHSLPCHELHYRRRLWSCIHLNGQWFRNSKTIGCCDENEAQGNAFPLFPCSANLAQVFKKKTNKKRHQNSRLLPCKSQNIFCSNQKKLLSCANEALYVFVFVNLWGSIKQSSLLRRSKSLTEGRSSPSSCSIVMFVVYICTLNCVSFF